MTTTADDLTAEIRVECAAVGLPRKASVSGTEISRRRRELIATMVGVSIGVVGVSAIGTRAGFAFLGSAIVRTVLVLVAGALIAYAFEKQRHLGRLESLSTELADLEAQAAQRVIEQVVLSDVDDGLRKSLMVEDTLDGLLDGAIELTRADGGTLYLVGQRDTPSVWTRRGPISPDVTAGSAATWVARTAEPVAVDVRGDHCERGGERIAAPLVANGMVVGVIELVATARAAFDLVDLELLARFATSAAGALDGSALLNDSLGQPAGATVDLHTDDYF